MSVRPLTIDLHTHVLPDGWPDLRERYGADGFVQLEREPDGCSARMMRDGQCFRVVSENLWSPERRLEECDRAGVDVQVLSTVPVMFSYWARPEHALDLSRLLNDHVASIVARWPRRFVGLGTIPLQDPDRAIAELERCVSELGLAGVQIGTHVHGWNLDHPELFPVLERAAELGAAVFVHPWDMLARERMSRHWLQWLVGMPTETALAICSLVLGGVLDRLPDLRVAFAHGGGSFPGMLGRIEHGFRVRPDLVATSAAHPPGTYLPRLWVDSLVHEPEALRRIIGLFGAERVCLGTDYPFPLGEARPGELIASLTELDETERRALLGGAALAFLGRSASSFA